MRALSGSFPLPEEDQNIHVCGFLHAVCLHPDSQAVCVPNWPILETHPTSFVSPKDFIKCVPSRWRGKPPPHTLLGSCFPLEYLSVKWLLVARSTVVYMCVWIADWLHLALNVSGAVILAAAANNNQELELLGLYLQSAACDLQWN